MHQLAKKAVIQMVSMKNYFRDFPLRDKITQLSKKKTESIYHLGLINLAESKVFFD